MSLNSLGTSNGVPSSRMTHSLSTPSGVDGQTTATRSGGKKLAVRVQMLDDSMTLFQVQVRVLIFNQIFDEIIQKKFCRQKHLEKFFMSKSVGS